MITNAGKSVIKRVFAGQLPRVASLLVVGSGAYDAVVSETDTGPSRESYRASITSISADLANDRIVFKATIPSGTIAKMGEVGLIQGESLTFRPVDIPVIDDSSWSDADGLSSSNARNNVSAVVFSVPADSTLNPIANNLSIDLSDYSDRSSLFVSYAPTTANLESFDIRFISSQGNYYEYSVTPTDQANTYAVSKLQKSSATVTGSPSWKVITQIELVLTSKSAGPVDIHLDGVRFETAPDSAAVLVAKSVLTEPVLIDSAIDTEVEYSLVINV